MARLLSAKDYDIFVDGKWGFPSDPIPLLVGDEVVRFRSRWRDLPERRDTILVIAGGIVALIAYLMAQ